MTRNPIIDMAIIVATSIETDKPPAIIAIPDNNALSRFIKKMAPKNGKANGSTSDKIIARPNKNPIKT
jgi:hypothetical protein